MQTEHESDNKTNPSPDELRARVRELVHEAIRREDDDGLYHVLDEGLMRHLSLARRGEIVEMLVTGAPDELLHGLTAVADRLLAKAYAELDRDHAEEDLQDALGGIQ